MMKKRVACTTLPPIRDDMCISKTKIEFTNKIYSISDFLDEP